MAGVNSRTKRTSKSDKFLDFAAGLKSFLGYLEGTQKAAHTVKNYRLDILAFRNFLEARFGAQGWRLDSLGAADIEAFHEALRSAGLRTNTRRRKLLTVQRFLTYLTRRNNLPQELGRKHPTPHKVERIPLTVSSSELIRAARELPSDPPLLARNRVLLWTLAESGCLVSEVVRLRFSDFDSKGLTIPGKASRRIPVSADLLAAVKALPGKEWLFLGHNKFGSMGAPISPRGVEMLVRSYALRLLPGAEGLTPRTLRHSAVLRWFEEGKSQDEIQALLGLKTAYAFRAYLPLIKSQLRSKSKTTSTSETPRPKS